jgi:hypothetical protein
MKNAGANLNLLIAWLWILLGFVSGMMMGFFFHREEWLGGYASHKRRLYRLAHISFFGLGLVNLCFYLTIRVMGGEGNISLASWAFVAGAVTMPICCIAMAHAPNSRPLFGVPVLSLLLGGVLTFWRTVQNLF